MTAHKRAQSHTTRRNKTRTGSFSTERDPLPEQPAQAPRPLNDKTELENPKERHSHREDQPYDEEGPGGTLRLDDAEARQ